MKAWWIHVGSKNLTQLHGGSCARLCGARLITTVRTAHSGNGVKGSVWNMQADDAEALWDITQPPLFGTAQRDVQLPQGGKMLSFDALMAVPQGRPIAVRMQRDATARAPSQPLVRFFQNALGLSFANKCAFQCRSSRVCEYPLPLNHIEHMTCSRIWQWWRHGRSAPTAPLAAMWQVATHTARSSSIEHYKS